MILTIFFIYTHSVDCVWSDWSMATTCSKSCGGGKQLQTRTIAEHEQNGGALCTGENIQEIDCNTNGCTVGNSLSLHLYEMKKTWYLL